MSQTRERILDALQAQVAQAGPAGATLDAVAARAGVSKGGLLYHFGTKEALFAGLLERLRAHAAADIAGWESGGDDLVSGYLRSSSDAGGDYTAALLTALRLVGTPGVDVEGAVVDSFGLWSDALARHLDDPVLARLVTLVGDGLYLHALVGAAPDDLDHAVVDGLAARARAAAPAPEAG